jgi:hypothetical protein
MKKRVLVILGLFLINFVSAQFFGGYGYSSFSLTNFFDSLDPTTVTYVLLFFIFFTVIFLILSKISLFKGKRDHFGREEPNKAGAGIVSFAISALIVYYMYRNGYNLESFFYEIGFSGSFLSLIFSILAVVIALFIIWKFKVPGFFITLGTLFILVSLFTNLIYETGLAFMIGVILIIIGFIFWKSFRGWWGRNVHGV